MTIAMSHIKISKPLTPLINHQTTFAGKLIAWLT